MTGPGPGADDGPVRVTGTRTVEAGAADVTVERVELPLSTPFTISRGTTAVAENVLLRFDRDGVVGVGAAAPSTHYGETADTAAAVLPALLTAVGDVDPFETRRVERRLAGRVRANPAARAAVSVAVHDWVCRSLAVPLYRHLGLAPDRAVPTSFTLGVDDPATTADRAAEAAAAGYPVLKVKLGGEGGAGQGDGRDTGGAGDDRGPVRARDVERVRRVREAAPDVRIRVDANEAWTAKEAVRTCEAIAEYGVEFVEQPVPAEKPAALRHVHEHGPLPVAADESCLTAADVPQVADRCDVVVVKLMKCGGIGEAVRTIHAARAHGLSVMLGCMVESSAAIAAAAHLTPLADYADLDGSLLLAGDPYDGPVREGGRIELSERPGTGAVRGDGDAPSGGDDGDGRRDGGDRGEGD